MNRVSRKTFLNALGVGITMTALNGVFVVTASAENGMVEFHPDEFMDEMNDWYQANGIDFFIDEMDDCPEKISVEDYENLIQELQSVRTVVTNGSVSNSISNSMEMDREEKVSPREIMPVSFTRSDVQNITTIFKDGVSGTLNVEITVNGIIDVLRNQIIHSDGSACERNSVNLASLSLGQVSTIGDTPSGGDISYSVDCDVYFEWTEPSTNIKFRTHENQTLSGYVSY